MVSRIKSEIKEEMEKEKETKSFELIEVKDGKYFVKIPNLSIPLQLNEFLYAKLKEELLCGGKSKIPIVR